MQYIPYIAVVLLAASMLFALLSYALRRYSITRLEERLIEADRQNALEQFLTLEESFMMSASIWRMLINVVLVMLLSIYVGTDGQDSAWKQTMVAAIAVIAILALGVAVPMAWARYNSERIIVSMMPLMNLMRITAWPLLAIMKFVDNLIRRLSGVSEETSREDELEDELLSVVKEGEIEGTLEEEEKEMIESIIEFRNSDVAQIMTPRTDMASLSHDTSLAEARDFIVAEGHSRVPVYEETLDTIVGVLYAKDLLAAGGQPDFEQRAVDNIMRSPLFIPETKNLTDLLHDFQNAGVHIAIVLDEYGGTQGLVTIEDIIEEIVGEITDEYDESEPEEFRRISETTCEVDARARIGEVNDELGIELPENDDYETLAGFVFSELGHIPKIGQTMQYRGLTVTVLNADERRILRVKIDGLDQFVAEEK